MQTTQSPGTALQAAALSLHYAAVAAVRLLQAADRAVHRHPYPFILALAALFTIASYAAIGSARAERDSACKHAAHLQQQVESLTCAVEAGKEVRP